ncbi:MAG: FAD-dependent oxidoreductase [Betaproteobacteria bacterium]|nr:FAD-dependent oxidoreductase [Betaproteobacteria bacterium]
MAFLPFYIPNKKRIKIIIVGGGYAGMAALSALTRYAENIEIIIVDPREQHIKVTHLHETFRYPLSDLQVSFADLTARFDFRHIQEELLFDENILQQWQADKCIALHDEVVAFDYLLIASGCGEAVNQQIENVLSLQDFMTLAGSDLLTNHLAKSEKTEHSISVIGGGATGIQFLFEVEQFLRRKRINAKLRLIHSGDRVLEQFPKGFDSYVQSCIQDSGIEFFPNTYYREQQIEKILLEEKNSKKQFELPSDLTLLFLGKKKKKQLVANAFGQLLIDQKVLQNIFVAGDCSFYNSLGSNILAAQSAVRKGKLAARNILRHSSVIGLLEPYLHHELGYVVSLGSTDAVGWLVSEGNVVSGMPALAIKELVETQYDLLLVGVDTYLI